MNMDASAWSCIATFCEQEAFIHLKRVNHHLRQVTANWANSWSRTNPLTLNFRPKNTITALSTQKTPDEKVTEFLTELTAFFKSMPVSITHLRLCTRHRQEIQQVASDELMHHPHLVERMNQAYEQVRKVVVEALIIIATGSIYNFMHLDTRCQMATGSAGARASTQQKSDIDFLSQRFRRLKWLSLNSLDFDRNTLEIFFSAWSCTLERFDVLDIHLLPESTVQLAAVREAILMPTPRHYQQAKFDAKPTLTSFAFSSWDICEKNLMEHEADPIWSRFIQSVVYFGRAFTSLSIHIQSWHYSLMPFLSHLFLPNLKRLALTGDGRFDGEELRFLATLPLTDVIFTGYLTNDAPTQPWDGKMASTRQTPDQATFCYQFDWIRAWILPLVAMESWLKKSPEERAQSVPHPCTTQWYLNIEGSRTPEEMEWRHSLLDWPQDEVQAYMSTLRMNLKHIRFIDGYASEPIKNALFPKLCYVEPVRAWESGDNQAYLAAHAEVSKAINGRSNDDRSDGDGAGDGDDDDQHRYRERNDEGEHPYHLIRPPTLQMDDPWVTGRPAQHPWHDPTQYTRLAVSLVLDQIRQARDQQIPSFIVADVPYPPDASTATAHVYPFSQPLDSIDFEFPEDFPQQFAGFDPTITMPICVRTGAFSTLTMTVMVTEAHLPPPPVSLDQEPATDAEMVNEETIEEMVMKYGW